MAVSNYNGVNHGSRNGRHGSVARKEQPVKATETDIQFENYGSLFLLRPVSSAGKIWLAEHIAEDAQMLGEAYACELRFVEDIFRGASADGMVCG